MAEDGDARRADRGEHAGGLVLGAAQLRVRRRHDELEAGAARRAADRGLPSARMLASMPLNTRNRPSSVRVQRVDLRMLPGHRFHAHAPRDRQAVRVVGDPEAGVAERQAGLDHRRERLAAVAPGRVHLEVAAERRLGHDRRPAASAPSTCRIACSLRKPARSARAAATSAVLALTLAIAASTVAERPVSTHSCTIRALAGPTNAHVAQRAGGDQLGRPARAARRSPSPRACSRTGFARSSGAPPCRRAATRPPGWGRRVGRPARRVSVAGWQGGQPAPPGAARF